MFHPKDERNVKHRNLYYIMELFAKQHITRYNELFSLCACSLRKRGFDGKRVVHTVRSGLHIVYYRCSEYSSYGLVSGIHRC